jgi:cytochrome c biogenesis protein CcdA
VVTAYGAGAVAASAVLGLVVGWLGRGLGEPTGGHLAAVAVLALACGAADLGVFHLRTPTVRRQTERLWWFRLRKPVAAFVWGLDLGVVVTSIRVSSLAWVALAVAFLSGSAWRGALVMALYGIGLVANLIAATLVESRRVSPSAPAEEVGEEFGVRLLTLQPGLRRVAGASLVAWGVGAAAVVAVVA